MPAVDIVLACETLLVVTGIIWMTAVVRTRARVAGVDRPRFGLLRPTGGLMTTAALAVCGGWVVNQHPVPNLLLLAVLGVRLPAVAGMALALIIRQEEPPTVGVRGWLVYLVPVVGGGMAGFAPQEL
ncbi:hypothetical protein ACIBKX_33475 [Streptomyces sp. NPDC050658]|uniref:hypothetical protein n=1 Tax=unclassified Streptomyces TaxID=2593676 RepID=UPI00343FAD9F